MTDHDDLDARLQDVGSAPVTPPDDDFLDALEGRLRDHHDAATATPRRTARVLIPVAAAAAMIVVVAIFAVAPGDDPASTGVADTPPTPTTADGGADEFDPDAGTTEPADPDPADPGPGGDDPGDDESDQPSPTTTVEPATRPTTTTTAPATDTTATSDPPTRSTMPAEFALRATAQRRDDGAVVVAWEVHADIDAAGWRIRRQVGDDRPGSTIVLEGRDPSLRRFVDRAAPDRALTYVVLALADDGSVITEARAATP